MSHQNRNIKGTVTYYSESLAAAVKVIQVTSNRETALLTPADNPHPFIG
jgi:hypothetical protein